ncbi:MAG: flavin reductase family protein [Clostridia bacterium]|nr:flavin reductase family protein [Clostridia bacterium]
MQINALTKLNYGVYIVSSAKEDKLNGQIANCVFQVTAEPAVVAVSINKDNLTHEYIHESGCFSLSVLNTEADFKFIGKFGFRSGRDIDKFEDTEFKEGVTGCPIVTERCSAWLEFKVVDTMDVGTHTLFLGELVDAEILKDVQPMTYQYYHEVIKGKSPKSAPTYIDKSL